MNFYSKHSSPLFQKINSTIANILSSRTHTLGQQISLYQKIVNELLKNSMMDEFKSFQHSKLLALQLVLLIAQNNDSSFHSVSYWENMMKSNQIVSYFASISNVLRTIQDMLIDLQSQQQSIHQNKTKIRGKLSKHQGRPLLLTSYRQQFSNMVQNLQSKFRQGAASQTQQDPLNQQENEALIQQLQELIQKKDFKIKQIQEKTERHDEQMRQFEILVQKLEQKNAQYSKKIEKIEKELNNLRIANQQSQLQKMQLKQLNRQLSQKNNNFFQGEEQTEHKNNCKFGGTQHTMSSLPGATHTSANTIQNPKQKAQLTSLKSFRRINNKEETSQRQAQKNESESNLVKMLYCQALTIQNLL